MSARLLAEWEAYSQLEPFGPPADFWQNGAIRSTLYNVNRAKKSQKEAKPEDFMPTCFTDDLKEPADVSEQVVTIFQDLKRLAQHGE